MFKKIDYLTQEIKKVELTIINVRKEIKTLKRRIAGYKGWTKRYRKQKQELLQENKILHGQLSSSIEEAVKAKEQRDTALKELDDLILRIESFQSVCTRFSRITYARKEDIVKEAEKLLFEERIPAEAATRLDKREQPQMFTDPASINRSLLDR